MTGIGNTGYNDLIRQALSAGRGNAKTRNSETSEVGSFGSAIQNNIRNINFDSSTLERMESKRGSNDRWTSSDLYAIDTDSLRGYTVNKDALNKVREKLKDEGIDADSRTPTHEITDEQMEWLGSKYDLEFLSVCSFTHSEYGNFMLDLAYLNVFSLDEVENMYGVMPFNANNKALLYYYGDPKTGEGAGYIDSFGGDGSIIGDWDETYTQLIMEYLKAKYTDRTESEYKRMTEEFKVQRLERMLVIEIFFARFAENKESFIPAVSKPDIENASEKLKEDFGKLV